MKISIGIDPGKSGAIVSIVDGQVYSTIIIPTIGGKVDLNELAIMFDLFIARKNIVDTDIHVVMEDTHSIFGTSAKSNFQFGWVNGVLEAMIVANSMPYTKVQPKAWQKEMWQGVQPVLINTGKLDKNGKPKHKVDTKATSLLAAKRLFPGESFLATDRSKVPHDGIVDALLMAEYCRRNF